MSNGYPPFLLNDEQMSNKVGGSAPTSLILNAMTMICNPIVAPFWSILWQFNLDEVSLTQKTIVLCWCFDPSFFTLTEYTNKKPSKTLPTKGNNVRMKHESHDWHVPYCSWIMMKVLHENFINLDLFKVIFYFVPWDSSPSHHPLGEYVRNFFQASKSRKSKWIEQWK